MKPMIFESHAHYDSHQFNEDREEILSSMQENGVGTIVNVCADWDSVTEVVDMVQNYPFMYARVGLHPDEVGDLDDERFKFLKSQCQKEKLWQSEKSGSTTIGIMSLTMFRKNGL